MRKVISSSDRLEALSRIEEYREDWERYELLRASGPKTEEDDVAQKMCIRWGIRAPFRPFFAQSVNILDEKAVEIVDKIQVHAPPLEDNRVDQAIERVAAKREGRIPGEQASMQPIEGHYLYLKLDMTQPSSVLMDEFEKVLDSYKPNKNRIPGGGRKKQSNICINKWEIFDTCRPSKGNEQGFSTPYSLANSSNASTVKEIDNYRKQATNALEEAIQIIAMIRSEAGLG